MSFVPLLFSLRISLGLSLGLEKPEAVIPYIDPHHIQFPSCCCCASFSLEE